MKKGFLLLSAATLLFAANVSMFGQSDITPEKWKFHNMEVGVHNDFVDYFHEGKANPTQPYPNCKPNGTMVVGGGQFADATHSTANYANVKSAMNIVNTEFGKMLMIKGANSTETVGTKATGSIAGFWNINMYSQTDYPANTKVRVAIVARVIPAFEFKVSALMAGGGAATAAIPTGTILYNDEVDDTKDWVKVEGDFGATNDIANTTPIRVKFEVPGGVIDGSAIYLAKMSLTANPEGDFSPIEILENPGVPTSIFSAMGDSKTFLSWDAENIYVNEATEGEIINVYTISGQLVKTAVVTGALTTVPMNKGAYIVKVGNKTTKVIL